MGEARGTLNKLGAWLHRLGSVFPPGRALVPCTAAADACLAEGLGLQRVGHSRRLAAQTY